MKNSYLISVFIFISQIIVAQTITFEAPKKIIKKCNAFTEFGIYSLDSTIGNKIYFYYENAIIDTLSRKDSTISITENCLIFDTIVSIDYFELRSGRIYILNEKGKLLNKKPFDNVKVILPKIDVYIDYDVFCGEQVFYSYEASYPYSPVSLKPGVTSCHFYFDFLSLGDDHLQCKYFMVERKGLWGLMDLKGKMIAEPQYSDIIIDIKDNNKIHFYKNGILVKTINDY